VKELHIRETIVPGRRLGRHVRHDPRSLRYLAPAADLSTLKSVRHVRHIPVLDQGDLGSCTGNAAEGALGTSPLYDALAEGMPHRPTGDAEVDEEQARALYSTATTLDGYDGEWPPLDTGSDGLSVAKAALAAGLISGYTHATTLEAALTALAAQPVIAGINWYDTFDSPDKTGRVRIGPGATVRGGHEIVLDELDVERRLVWFTNSWSSIWGKAGRAAIGWDDFARLLSEDGDVTVFVPLSQPAPTPTPPAPADPLAELATLLRQFWTGVESWLSKHGL
jgi:hypothetical protein